MPFFQACPIPIKQSIAVTGSVNQRGKFNPSRDKSEDRRIFRSMPCQRVNREQGVLMPAKNIKNLMLRDEVINAVKDREIQYLGS
jgi:predicted ATP-dependent protease